MTREFAEIDTQEAQQEPGRPLTRGAASGHCVSRHYPLPVSLRVLPILAGMPIRRSVCPGDRFCETNPIWRYLLRQTNPICRRQNEGQMLVATIVMTYSAQVRPRENKANFRPGRAGWGCGVGMSDLQERTQFGPRGRDRGEIELGLSTLKLRREAGDAAVVSCETNPICRCLLRRTKPIGTDRNE